MLVKKYEVDDMSICDEHIICEECPCFVGEHCVFPYVNIGKCTEDTIKQIREKFPYFFPKEGREEQKVKNN